MTNAEIAEMTKDSVTASLLELMSSKEYEKITMKEIAEKSGFGRATVYRYFQTKEDMLRYYFSRHAATFNDIVGLRLDNEDDYYEIIFRVFSMLKKERKDIELLMKAKLEGLYLDFLNKSMTENFKTQHYNESVYAAYYFAGSLFNVSMQWIRNGCDISVKKLSEIYYDKLFVSPEKQEEKQ